MNTVLSDQGLYYHTGRKDIQLGFLEKRDKIFSLQNNYNQINYNISSLRPVYSSTTYETLTRATRSIASTAYQNSPSTEQDALNSGAFVAMKLYSISVGALKVTVQV